MNTKDPMFKIKTDEETATYGRFSIEPLEQGYGQTMGNSLRRVLLTSLPGAAITSIALEGAKHRFSTIAGLKEDVGELIINIKKVRLIISGDTDEPVTLHLDASGPGEVTAGDIEVSSGVEIVNPDVVLGTLADKKARLTMTITAKKGYGYVPVDEHKEDGAIGTIFLDALYSPVRRVNYKVEATRVGRMTNLDRLVLEIWTDGTVSPMTALKQSASIIQAYCMQIIEPKVAGIEEKETKKSLVSDELLRMRIEEFDIPTRIVNALAKGGIETISQLLTTDKEDLMKVKNLGGKSLDVVSSKLKEKGIEFSV